MSVTSAITPPEPSHHESTSAETPTPPYRGWSQEHPRAFRWTLAALAVGFVAIMTLGMIVGGDNDGPRNSAADVKKACDALVMHVAVAYRIFTFGDQVLKTGARSWIDDGYVQLENSPGKRIGRIYTCWATWSGDGFDTRLSF